MPVKPLADVGQVLISTNEFVCTCLATFISSFAKALNLENYEALRRKLQLLEHLVQLSEDSKLVFVSEEDPKQPKGKIASLQSAALLASAADRLLVWVQKSWIPRLVNVTSKVINFCRGQCLCVRL